MPTTEEIETKLGRGLQRRTGADYLDVLHAPASFSYAATRDLDLTSNFNHQLSNTLTGNIAFTLLNGVDGCKGRISVVQDSTGGRTASVAASGRTMVNRFGSTGALPTAASSRGYIDYEFATVNGVAIVWLDYGANGFGYNCSDFSGADFGARLQAAINALPSTGGIIDCTDFEGAQAFSADLTINKAARIYMGGCTTAMGTYKIYIRASGASIIGIAKIDENNSPTRFTYSGTSDAILLQHSTTATALFGNVLADFELSATGSAATSSSAYGISSYGTRYNEFRNIQVFNFQQGKALYYTGNGAVVDGFGATNTIINPALSTNKYGIFVDSAGGSASTHGLVYGGYMFGSTTGFDSACESWRFFGTDFGGTPGVKIRAGADDTVLTACRWEASTSEVVIDSSVLRTQIIAPSFINHQGGGLEVTDNGTGTVILTTSSNTDSKLRGLKSQVNYANKGTTASLAAGASENVLDMSAGGVWLVAVRQSDGGTGWRASAIVYSSGVAVTVASIESANVTITSSGTNLRLTNAHGSTAQALAWSVLKFEGAAQF